MDLSDPTTLALLAADACAQAGLGHALYGGLMLAAYGEPRETRDADLAVTARGVAEAQAALAARGLTVTVSFDGVSFGGLSVSRVAVLGCAPVEGLHTVDLVRPISDRYAEAVIRRAPTVRLRGAEIPVVSPEDFLVLKALSTRERDLADAASVVRRTGTLLDWNLISREVRALARELPDFDVAARLAEIERRAAG